AHLPLGPGAADELAELGDPRLLLGDPLVHGLVGLFAGGAREEFDAQLLEVTGKSGDQQPLPLVARNKPGDLLLRPVESERLAKTSVGASEGQFLDLAMLGECGDPEDAVQLVEANEPANDLLARTKRD